LQKEYNGLKFLLGLLITFSNQRVRFPLLFHYLLFVILHVLKNPLTTFLCPEAVQDHLRYIVILLICPLAGKKMQMTWILTANSGFIHKLL